MKKLLLIALLIVGCDSPTINSNTDFETVMMTDEVGYEIGVHGDGVYSECFTGDLYRSISSYNYIPTNYNIGLPYPNPTNGGISTQFTIPEETNVKILIIDKNFEIILTLINDEKDGGTYPVFHSLADDGEPVLEEGYYRIIYDFDSFECYANFYFTMTDPCWLAGGEGCY